MIEQCVTHTFPEADEGLYARLGEIHYTQIIKGYGIQIGSGHLESPDTPPAFVLSARNDDDNEAFEIIFDWQDPYIKHLKV